MYSQISRLALSVVATATLAFPLTCAHAQSYPSKPVRLLVPYSAGGGTDFFARTVGQKMAEGLGQPVIIENRPGASTIIGAETAAKSAPDGYTAFVADSTTIAVNPSLYKKLPYDAEKDFAPVTLTARFALLLVVSPTASKATNVKEFVEEARKANGQMSYASVGVGTTHHLVMEMFQERAGIKLIHVTYKGGPPAIQDVAGGQIPAMFIDLAAGAPMIKAGKLRVLGVASLKRIPALPDVPTLVEQGFPNFEAWAWQGLVVPTGTSKEIIAKLNGEYAKAVADPAIRNKLVEAGVEPVTSTPEQMAAYVKSESAKWSQIIKRASIRVD